MQVDKKIFEDLAKFYGDSFHLPPLAAKIYAYLLFDFEGKGVCFEQFVNVLHASKSSVSSSLNLLLKSGLIKDFNIESTRKRLFIVNENYMKISFEELVTKMNKEVQLMEKLQDLRRENGHTFSKRIDLYKSLLHKNIINLQETLHKLQ